LSGKRLQVHSINSFARVRGSRIMYPLDPGRLGADAQRTYRPSLSRSQSVQNIPLP
jgi:hypothetical protein